MNKILSLSGFSAKAGRLSYGYEAAEASLKAGKSRLVITAEDISKKTLKEVKFFAEKAKVRVIELAGVTINDISESVGRKCGIISVNDSGFANACLKAYDNQGGSANDQ